MHRQTSSILHSAISFFIAAVLSTVLPFFLPTPLPNVLICQFSRLSICPHTVLRSNQLQNTWVKFFAKLNVTYLEKADYQYKH